MNIQITFTVTTSSKELVELLSFLSSIPEEPSKAPRGEENNPSPNPHPNVPVELGKVFIRKSPEELLAEHMQDRLDQEFFKALTGGQEQPEEEDCDCCPCCCDCEESENEGEEEYPDQVPTDLLEEAMRGLALKQMEDAVKFRTNLLKLAVREPHRSEPVRWFGMDWASGADQGGAIDHSSEERH